MKTRVFSLVLVLIMVFTMLPCSVWAAEEPAESLRFSCDNPLYAAYIPDEGISTQADETLIQESRLLADDEAAEYVSLDIAVKQLRDAMMRRESPVRLYIDYPGGEAFSSWGNEKLFFAAMDMENAESATDGDYLRWSWQSMNAEAQYSGSHYTVTMSIRYYTTYEQEQEAISEMGRILAALDLEGLTDYGKAMSIHQYIAEHVTYDHDGLAAMDQQLAMHKKKDVEQAYFLPFTAYAALTKGTAVCQGYATLYYAMCRMAELPVRLIASSNHAWNIVQIDGQWYNLDVTADSDTETKTRWFLKGSTTFESPAAGGNHKRVEPYSSEAFQREYPVGEKDYAPTTSYWDVREDNGHKDDIERITQLKLMNGMGSAERPVFSPLSTMQRGMLVTVLYRMEGEPEVSTQQVFSDVPAGCYYTDAVAWAAANGVVEGDGNGIFRPEDALKRQELVKILYHYASKVRGLDDSEKADLSSYKDRGELATWALEATRWSVGTGIVKGVTDTELAPNSNAKREQLATMLVRFLDHYEIDPAA